MRANRRKNTGPELAVRRGLHARGLRYRVDYPIRIPGARLVRPDVVFTRHGVAVFIDGCFWHGCPDHKGHPKTNTEYWGPKLAGNVKRDRQQTEALRIAGWRVLRFWEHEHPDAIADAIQQALRWR